MASEGLGGEVIGRGAELGISGKVLCKGGRRARGFCKRGQERGGGGGKGVQH